MDGDRLGVVLDRVYSVAYIVAVCALLLVMIPGLRPRLGAFAGQQAQAWRYGRWMARQTPVPAWLRELQRAELPQEP